MVESLARDGFMQKVLRGLKCFLKCNDTCFLNLTQTRTNLGIQPWIANAFGKLIPSLPLLLPVLHMMINNLLYNLFWYLLC